MTNVKSSNAIKEIYERLIFLNGKVYSSAFGEKIRPTVYACRSNDKTPPVFSERYKLFSETDIWGLTPDEHLWFYFRIDGEILNSEKICFSLSTGTTDNDWNVLNPQFLVYIDGCARQAFDANHRELFLDGGREYEIYINAYNGLHFSAPVMTHISLSSVFMPALDLYYKVGVLLSVADMSDHGGKLCCVIVRELNDTIGKIDFTTVNTPYYKDAIYEATEKVNKIVDILKDDFNPVAYAVGSSHLDVAWRWTVNQTREKAQRTAATALEYLREFPEYKFYGPQALLYKYIKEENPYLYEEIKKAVKDGRWGIDGGVYVEPDCNVTSGESLIRQISFGKKFFTDEFGVKSSICFLPDSFGFSASFPQILKKSGITNFYTTKIFWNDTEEFPYDLFTWRGIDGSGVTAYFCPSYGMLAEPSKVEETYRLQKHKSILDEYLFLYGYSDGGGGPTFQHIKNIQTMSKSIRNCPKTVFSTLDEFNTHLNESIKDKKIDTYKGELYLQFHRGTLTSMASVKRNNRKAEFGLMNAELLCSLAEILSGDKYPHEELNSVWEKVLVNQFHDILPGTAIKEQYQLTEKDYDKVFSELSSVTEKAKTAISNYAGGTVVFNPHSFNVDGVAETDGKFVVIKDIPPKGYKSIDKEELIKSIPPRKETPYVLENEYYKVVFNEQYEIISVFDKSNKVEVLDGTGNELVAYVDQPHCFDAWEIRSYYKDIRYTLSDLQSAEFVSKGRKFGYRITRKFRNSSITQFICLIEGKRGIIFETVADWKEDHILLKTEFPVSVAADKAVFDIQFGKIERSSVYNTLYDKSQYEACGQKYADLCDCSYGVALINDCKYGYDVHDGVISMSLIKCATDPNVEADIGMHEFSYCLFPHLPDETDTVLKEAYLFNNPVMIIDGDKKRVEPLSLVTVSADNVIIETVKKAEDGSGYIFRIYESSGRSTTAKATFFKEPSKVCVCDMLENEETPIKTDGAIVNLTLKMFEIITLKVLF